MKAEINRRRFRIACLWGVFALVFAVIGARAIYLQVYRGPWLSAKAAVEYEKDLEVQGRRGSIQDAAGREMAVSIDVTSIAAYPARAGRPEAAAVALNHALDVDPVTLRRRLTSNRSFVWIKRQASPRQAEAVRALKLDGIDFIPEHSRFYPHRALAAQVLGFTGIDGRGLEGIEFYYDTWLRGRAGSFTLLKDALGRGFGLNRMATPEYSGHNIVLTIDQTIQYMADKALEEGVARSAATSGMAIVMDPATGGVLALSHYPFFNPNDFAKFDRNLWRNRAVTDPFEPGSTIKIFTAAAAMEFGGCGPDTIFFCENGNYSIGEDTIHDTTPHGWLTLEKVIKHSSNIGAVKVGETIGPEALYRGLRAFGFGEKTDIDCPGETIGSLVPFNRWSRINTGTISYGHGISVSAIQLVTAVSAIANDGVLMRPYIVSAITDAAGRAIERFGPRKARQAVSAATAFEIKRMMLAAVEAGGTGTRAALPGYDVCGKTGTAIKADEYGAYAQGRYLASFVGFAPADHPRVAILVVIDDPGRDHYGGLVAAPVFRTIAHGALSYLNVPPRIGPNQLTASRIKNDNG